VSMAMLWSVLMSKTRTALICSVLSIVFGALLGITLVDQIMAATSTPDGVVIAVTMLPPCCLYRILWEFSQAAFNADYLGIDGLTWSDWDGDAKMDQVLLIMVVEWASFLLLALYLDNVLDTGVGIPRHPLFCCPQALQQAAGGHDEAAVAEEYASEGEIPAERKDVVEEVARINAMDENDPATRDAVMVRKIWKVYASNKKRANKGVTFGVRHGECLGLLGPNGAGKTTCIHALCGSMQPTSGDALVEGLNIRSMMRKIYTIMGVCTQHDHLWDTLTAREHLMFYGRLKSLQGLELEEAIKASLEAVQLMGHIDQAAGTFSGGMKRRLSVAIALIGKPLVVYLDEPSTGLDPASRRTLWKAIKEAKKISAVLLTTHAMDEAEVLCDRLGIFIDGALHCLAPPKRLTERFGGTYVLSVSTLDHSSHSALENMVRTMAPSMRVSHSISNTKIFELLTSEVTLSVVFKTMLENSAQLHIREWGIANTTLEEAFINIARGAIGT